MGKAAKKLVIYLDQNFISEIAKAKDNNKVRIEFEALFEALHKGFLEEKLTVPSSWFHEIESSLSPKLKEKIKQVQAYMGQVDLESKDEIYMNQVIEALKEFQGLPTKPVDFSEAFSDNIDDPLDRFKINFDPRLERFHNTRERQDTALRIDKIRQYVQTSGRKYTVQLEEELKSQGDYFLARESFRYRYTAPDEIIKEFAYSQQFKNVPIISIYSRLWSKLFTSHGLRQVQSGDATDIDIISSYLPYVDVMALDTFMANNVRGLGLDKEYGTMIFDAKGENLKAFVQYVEEYIATNPPVNIPNASIFVLPDRRITLDSFEYFRRLGSQCSRNYVDLYAFDNGNMPKYLHKGAGVTMPFTGLQDIEIIEISESDTRKSLLEKARAHNRTPKFVFIDSFRNLPDDFVKTVISHCDKNKKMVLGYPILNGS